MFASIRKYSTDAPGLIIPRVRNEFLPIIQQVPGFIGYYLITSERDSNEVTSISIFDSKESAVASNKLAMDWIKSTDISKHFLSRPEITAGDVNVSAEVNVAP